MDRTARNIYWGLFGLIWVALMLPFLWATYAPMHDWPNHLARVFILAHLDDVPAFRQKFGVAWLPYPNLAVDLCLLPLLGWVPPLLAGKLFLLSLPALFLWGTHRLACVTHGQPSFIALLSAYFFFNVFLFWGFVNYSFGVGLFLWSFSIWISFHQAPSVRGAILATVMATACYLAHMSAVGFLGVGMVLHLAFHRPRLSLRAAALRLVPLVPAGALVLFGGVPAPDQGDPFRWDNLQGKVKGVGSLFATYHPRLDAVLAVVFLVAAAVLLVRGRRALSRPLAAASLVLVLLFLAFPSDTPGRWAVDRRFLLPAVVLALSSLRPRGDRPERIAVVVALAVTLLRAGEVAREWRMLGQDIEERVSLLDAVPQGVPVVGFALVDRQDKGRWPREMRLVFLHQYAALIRLSPVNGLFAWNEAQPLRRREPDIVTRLPSRELAPAAFDWRPIFASQAYIFASRQDEAYRTFLGQHCERVAEHGDAALYRACTR